MALAWLLIVRRRKNACSNAATFAMLWWRVPVGWKGVANGQVDGICVRAGVSTRISGGNDECASEEAEMGKCLAEQQG
jgi:hypothetical protein